MPGMRYVTGFLLVVLLVGCGTGSTGTTTHRAVLSTSPSPTPTVSETPTSLSLQPVLEMKLGDAYYPNWRKTAAGCKGINGYDDLHISAGVTLYAANGDVAGSGFITESRVEGKKCILTATVDDVIPGDFYKVQFANRNEVAFSRQQLEDQSAVLTIG